MALVKLVFWKGKFIFKAHYPSTEKPRSQVGFETRTDPEMSALETTSAPVSPSIQTGNFSYVTNAVRF